MNPARSQRSFIVPIVVWGLVFTFWFVVSRNNHPTLLLNALATSVLVGCGAVGVLVWKQAFSGRPFVVRTALRILCVVALGTLAAVIIRLTYDLLLGPDPRRFSFVSNLMMDIGFVAIHVLIAGLVTRASKLWAYMVAFLMMTLFAQPSNLADEGLMTQQQMRDAVSWWRVGLADMHLVYERYSLPPGKCDLLTTVVDGPQASLKKFSETEWLWTERGLRLCDDRLFGTASHVGVRNVNIFNGSTNLWTQIHYQGQHGGTEKMVSLQVQFPSGQISGSLDLPLQGLSFPSGSLCDVLQEKSWIVEGTDKILGTECIRIRNAGESEWIWLDLSHHAMPRRHLLQFGEGSRRDYVVDELQQLDGGLWFPKRARVQFQNPDETSNQLIVVTKAEVNFAIDPARFEPPTPESETVVFDVRKRNASAVPAKAPETTSLDADDSFSTAAPRSGKWWNWTLLGVPLVVLLFLLRRIIVKSASL